MSTSLHSFPGNTHFKPQDEVLQEFLKHRPHNPSLSNAAIPPIQWRFSTPNPTRQGGGTNAIYTFFPLLPPIAWRSFLMRATIFFTNPCPQTRVTPTFYYFPKKVTSTTPQTTAPFPSQELSKTPPPCSCLFCRACCCCLVRLHASSCLRCRAVVLWRLSCVVLLSASFLAVWCSAVSFALPGAMHCCMFFLGLRLSRVHRPVVVPGVRGLSNLGSLFFVAPACNATVGKQQGESANGKGEVHGD